MFYLYYSDTYGEIFLYTRNSFLRGGITLLSRIQGKVLKKIKSLYQRDYEVTRMVIPQVVEGSEWVIDGEGVPTIKVDGTCCKIESGKLYRRYDRKLTKAANRKKKQGHTGPWELSDFKRAPKNWVPAEDAPNVHTGHWPGWLPVGNEPESKWFLKAWQSLESPLEDGTYELVGPHFQSNPHNLETDTFWRHGQKVKEDVPTDFYELGEFLKDFHHEGIVWHHPDGRMVKIKRSDYGYVWPLS